MQVDAVAPGGAVVPESQREQQPLEVTEGDYTLPVDDAIEHLVRLRHGWNYQTASLWRCHNMTLTDNQMLDSAVTRRKVKRSADPTPGSDCCVCAALDTGIPRSAMGSDPQGLTPSHP